MSPGHWSEARRQALGRTHACSGPTRTGVGLAAADVMQAASNPGQTGNQGHEPWTGLQGGRPTGGFPLETMTGVAPGPGGGSPPPSSTGRVWAELPKVPTTCLGRWNGSEGRARPCLPGLPIDTWDHPGASDGTRTHGIQDHNLALYHLSYARHQEGRDLGDQPARVNAATRRRVGQAARGGGTGRQARLRRCLKLRQGRAAPGPAFPGGGSRGLLLRAWTAGDRVLLPARGGLQGRARSRAASACPRRSSAASSTVSRLQNANRTKLRGGAWS